MDHLDPASLPPNSGWEVLWTSPNATQYFVEMDTFDPTSGVQIHYGYVDPTLGESTDGAIEGHLDQLGFIRMTVDDDGHVTLSVFTVSGQRVRMLVDGVREARRGTAVLDGRDLPAGLYYVKLEAAGRRRVEKVLLLR